MPSFTETLEEKEILAIPTPAQRLAMVVAEQRLSRGSYRLVLRNLPVKGAPAPLTSSTDEAMNMCLSLRYR